MGLLFDQTVHYQPTDSRNIHKMFEQFTYQPQIDYSYAPQIIWESPNTTATGATITTKKEAKSTQSQENDASGATDISQQDLFTPLVILAAVGVGGYILLKLLGPGKQKKAKIEDGK